MVRRSRHPKHHRRRRRRTPPQEGWLISELATLVGVTPRTIRYYLQKGLSLLVRSGGSPLVKKLAQQIYDHCVGAAQTSTAPPT